MLKCEVNYQNVGLVGVRLTEYFLMENPVNFQELDENIFILFFHKIALLPSVYYLISSLH
mgnify:CR=1 FL=1